LNQPETALYFFQKSYDLLEDQYMKYGIEPILNDLSYCTEQLTALQRRLGVGAAVTKDDPWDSQLWDLFREKIWNFIPENIQDYLKSRFPQTDKVYQSLAGKDSAPRPTLGFIIAACEAAKLPFIAHFLIDFVWWGNEAATEQKTGEQLE
jgi:hypothetical protein